MLHPRLIDEMNTLDEAGEALKEIARKLFYAGFDGEDWMDSCVDAWHDAGV